jgi:DNA-binding response OmpR family regulator
VKEKYAVLIVDDDPALLKMAGELLRGNYDVSCVKSGDEALTLLTTDYSPDVILLDVDMPGLSGFETLPCLREIEGARDIPVIFLTGVKKPEAELRGFSAGAVDYITKPFVREILLARLKVHSENGRRLRQSEVIKRDGRIDDEKFERLAADLNDTERKMLRLIALGYTNQEISDSLHYTYNYVKKVAGTIYEKKCVSKRNELKKLMM